MSATREAMADAGEQLAVLAGRVSELQAAAAQLPGEQRALFEQLQHAIEQLHREALLRLVRGLREEAAAAARLREVVRDPLVFGVLRLHGLVRDPLEQRVRAALASVQPMLAQHGGGVELVAVLPPDAVEIRLIGACRSCPASMQTLRHGVEAALREQAPELMRIVELGADPAAADRGAQAVSPFSPAPGGGFVDLCALEELPADTLVGHRLGGRELLLYRRGDLVHCMDNRCLHLGLPLSGAAVEDGVLTCRHHGFRYRLDNGDCLDLPGVRLPHHAVRLRAGRVAVKLGA
ncbi:NifU family protein [Frateuria defendens]|uniref:NifU family protein n=1 Tax=Frateuria defendens TaxID=2219559 RepID=UPI00137916B5|nr:NifU family protein [Frateuria defendens]